MRHARSLFAVAAIAATVALPAPAQSPRAKTDRPGATTATSAINAAAFKGLEFRNIGPANMGGRVDDFAVVESNPSTFYVGTASGGIFKTENSGVTFAPVFDDQEVSSIGDVTVAPSDPAIVYAGTGEPNNRQSSSWGNGVYRTLDGGKTWTHLGLEDTHHIGRIAVDPNDPDVAYVAALGRLWGPHQQRGLFKTSDGGKTWTNTKFIDEDTGFVDVAIDWQSPQTLYAASYQRRRAPFGYNGGGPGGGLWKTIDGGASWKKLTSGLPAEGDVGRIGIAIYRKDTRIVYALVEHGKEGGLYKSQDKGETWTKVSATNPRPSYYSKIHVDPNNDQRLWVLGAQMFNSEDGGKTFRTDLVQRIHGDYHALWINPANSDQMLAGSDGGIHLSFDRGRSWDYVNTIPLAQFYEVSLDNQYPYNVCGGLQDNGTWHGPSRTLYAQGIGNEDWITIGGGDGFYCVIDPVEPEIVYVESQDGNVQRIHLNNFERRVIRPEPADAKEKYRFNWNSPILISPHDHKTIYYGGNRLFGSKDHGETWTLATPDLTSAAARDTLPIFGKTAKDFLSRNDGVVHWGTITTVAESPLKAGILWVGTDDGNVQVSRDGGAKWTNVTARIAGVPKGTYVSRVEASRTGEGAAYVAFDGHRSNDFAAYVYRTDDFGQTWRSVAGNLPAGGTVSVVREHPKNADLLFAGTERGLWASFNRGGAWHRLHHGKLPTVPVDDIQIHPRDGDIVLGTHGRGVYVLDDGAPLAEMSEKVATSDLHLFSIRKATQWRIYRHKGNTGHKASLSPNPPDGALVTYHLKAKAGDMDEAKVSVTDAAGNLVREIKNAPKEAGVNRIAWDLRHEPPVAPEPGGGGFGGPPRGPLVPPGTYSVKVSVGTFSANQSVVVEEDPRIKIADADRKAWYDATREAAKLWAKADAANRAADAIQKQVTDVQESLKKSGRTTEAVTAAAKALADAVEPLAKRLQRQIPLGFAGAPLADEPDPLLPRARALYGTFNQITAPPTQQHRQAMERLSTALGEVATSLNALIDKDVPALNKLLFDNGIGRLEAVRRIP